METGQRRSGNMNLDQVELHATIRTAARRARLRSVQEVLLLSGLELQSRTGLNRNHVKQLLRAAAAAARPHRPITACSLLSAPPRLSLGCPVLDRLLRGGLPLGGITELSGESGAGKTQLSLQLCLSVQYPAAWGGLDAGAVFISTEDSFPCRRLQQLIQEQSCLRSDVPSSLINALRFSDGVYVEHAADLESLQRCLSRRVPVLLARGLVRLVVVDSLAALFRSEFEASDWLLRNKQLLSVSAALRQLSLQFNAPVLCVNQVSDVFRADPTLGPLSSGGVAPALGLAWANQVTVRLMMRRLQATVARGDQSSVRRRLDVVFAPHLARDGREAAVWREGLRGEETSHNDPSSDIP